MKVVEIFESIDGEGVRVGYPVTFIRLYGCNLNCSYCDSRYACEAANFTEMPIESIVAEVEKYGHKRITLTGGEPLIHPDVKFLINELLSLDYKVNIETNGSVDITPYCKKRDVLITMDYKCPSSNQESRMKTDNLLLLRKTDVLKFVVGSEEDLEAAKQVILNYELQGKCVIYMSPVFGKIESRRIVEFILENGFEGVRVQLQLHKFIYDPNARGV